MRNILIFFAIGLCLSKCAPSGNIEDYKKYHHVDTLTSGEDKVSVTFFGVSSLLFDDGESQFFIDGFISRPRAKKILFSKIETDKALISKIIEDYELINIKAVLTSHSHYDHSLDAAILAKLTNAKLIGSISTLNLGRGENLNDSLLIEFEPNKPFLIGDFKITVIHGKHSPPKLFNDDIGEVIDKPLRQPAKYNRWKEGGNYDFLIERSGWSFYVKASPNYIVGALDDVRADVLFLGTGSIGDQKESFKRNFYDETAGKLKPALIVPIHWDNFLKKDFTNLEMMPTYMDRGKKTFDYLIKRSAEDKIDFKILLGGQKMTFSQRQ